MPRSGQPVPAERRTGDGIAIPGDYQARALAQGFVVQRFWHAARARQLDRVLPPRPGAVVLDVGCGSGVIANRLAGWAGFVHAVDANPDAIAFARAHAAGENMAFHQALVDQICFDLQFDQVYCLELVEHLYLPQAAHLVALLAGLLKPGGELLVTTPNYAGPWPVIEGLMDALKLAPALEGEQHVSRFTMPRLRGLARGTSLRITRCGRFCGLAAFVSVISWKLALALERLERLASPLGNLLYVVFRKSGSPPA